MDKPIRSLHHVTATVSDAQDDLDFYTGLLGQRLVKKTVNFDNTRVYHFYYGDEKGTPGTIMTTFPYGQLGVRQGKHGAGQITVTSFSVPAGSLPFWYERLGFAGVPFTAESTGFGEDAIRFSDPSGLTIRLVESRADTRAPWSKPDINDASAVRGIHGVAGRALWLSPGEIVRADATPAAGADRTVHHVAFAVDDPNQPRCAELLRREVPVTEVMDRQCFKSTISGTRGVLFGVATILARRRVGSDLGVAEAPPWEEPNRPNIDRPSAVRPRDRGTRREDSPSRTLACPRPGAGGRNHGPRPRSRAGDILDLVPLIGHPDVPGASGGGSTWCRKVPETKEPESLSIAVVHASCMTSAAGIPDSHHAPGFSQGACLTSTIPASGSLW
jgi:catechol 2,3-dioxygenase-like lactoylglutathione lyase family enzyme